jgi:hypothetical protein
MGFDAVGPDFCFALMAAIFMAAGARLAPECPARGAAAGLSAQPRDARLHARPHTRVPRLPPVSLEAAASTGAVVDQPQPGRLAEAGQLAVRARARAYGACQGPKQCFWAPSSHLGPRSVLSCRHH